MKAKLEALPFANMQNNFAIGETIVSVIQQTPAQRGLFLVAQNGGRLKYGSVLGEWNDGEMTSVKEGFTKKPLDDHYSLMIENLKDQKTMLLSTESLPVGSYLRRRYEADGIKVSFLLFLGERFNSGFWDSLLRMFSSKYLHRKVFYLSFTSKTDALIDNKVILEIEAKANYIKNILFTNEKE